MSDYDLTKLSIEDLEREIARRIPQKIKEIGKNWYFKLNQEEDEEYSRNSVLCNIRTVWIVEKEFWHKNGYFEDRHLGKRVTMPPGFTECQESLFEFTVSYEEAKETLEAYGFSELT